MTSSHTNPPVTEMFNSRATAFAQKVLLRHPVQSVFGALPREVIANGILSRSAIRTDNSIIVFNWIEPHEDNVPFHTHDFDQTSLVLQGTLKFTLGDLEFIVNAGEVLQIPAGVPHKGLVVGGDQVFNIDVFAPIREDYMHLVEHQSHHFR